MTADPAKVAAAKERILAIRAAKAVEEAALREERGLDGEGEETEGERFARLMDTPAAWRGME